MARQSKNAKAAKNFVKRFDSWSLSRYLEHSGPDGCPLRARLKFIDKLDTGPAGPALQRGTDIHAAGARWLSGSLKKLPTEFTAFRAEMTWLKKNLECHEQDWAVNHEWGETGWFDPDAWGRFKLDALSKAVKKVMVNVDFKTGRYRPHKIEEYRLQGEVYGLVTLLRYPKTEVVHSELWYLDEGIIHGGEEDGYVYARDDLARLLKAWELRLKPMLTDRTFPARPGNYCTYCPFSAVKGGPCKY